MRNSITIAALAATCFFCSPVLASEVTPSSELEGDLLKSADVLGSYSLGGKLPVGAELTEHSSKTEISQGFGGYDDDGRGWYLDVSLGLFSPSLGDAFGDADEFMNTAFGGGILLGYQFNKNWSLDLDTILLTGSFEESAGDATYSGYSIMLNPRLTLPLGEKLSLFLSPGIGFGDFSIEIAGINFVSDTSFGFQMKGGLAYKISRKLDLFLQARYLKLTQLNKDIDDTSFSTFSPELGVKFDL